MNDRFFNKHKAVLDMRLLSLVPLVACMYCLSHHENDGLYAKEFKIYALSTSENLGSSHEMALCAIFHDSLPFVSTGPMLNVVRSLGATRSMMQAMDRIEGVNCMKLPWEGALLPTVRRQLGVFKDSVLKLLARDPAERPSMEQFCISCDRVLAGSTSVQL